MKEREILNMKKKEFLKEKHSQDVNISGKKDSQRFSKKILKQGRILIGKKGKQGGISIGEKGQTGRNFSRKRTSGQAAPLKRPRVIPAYGVIL